MTALKTGITFRNSIFWLLVTPSQQSIRFQGKTLLHPRHVNQGANYGRSQRPEPQFPRQLTEDAPPPVNLRGSGRGSNWTEWSHSPLPPSSQGSLKSSLPRSSGSGCQLSGGREAATGGGTWSFFQARSSSGPQRPPPAGPLGRRPQGPLTLHHLLRLLLPRAAFRRHVGCSSPFRNLSPQVPQPIRAPASESTQPMGFRRGGSSSGAPARAQLLMGVVVPS
ncbi:hypothetical protein P7K49_013237 [Saguinus oedipus]|uniref:Uncharacterized protein n=1 Tax=Saguinus oedipus TaxID=9490 RepID=A0ABQ9VFP9_SAGOE|nr:hypothetical protein P7K49_013237 [Saguinus oedipus]